MAKQIEIVVVGRDQVGATMRNVGSELKGLNQAAGKLAGVFGGNLLGSVMGLAGVAGFGALAIGAGKAALELGNMGMEMKQLEARFRAYSGGAQQAAANLGTMNAAVGLALTEDDQMIALNSLIAGGLAKNAGAAANLAQVAIWLGNAQQSATQRVEGLNQALLGGRVRSLIPYGVNLDELTARVKALQAANSGLSDSEATTQAFMEQASELMKRVQEQGGQAVTAVQEFRNAWANMLDVVASKTTTPADFIYKDFTRNVGYITTALQGGQVPKREGATLIEAGLAEVTTPAIERQRALLAQLEGDYTEVLDRLGRAKAVGATDMLPGLEEGVKYLKTQIDELTGAISNLAIETINWGSVAAGAASGAMAGFADLKAAVEKVPQSWLISGGQDVYGTGKGSWLDPHEALAQGKAAAKKNAEEAEKERLRLAKEANADAARDYAAQMSSAASIVGGYISDAVGQAKGLFDLTGGTKAGRNGPFEGVYRALDVAKRGTASPWAAETAVKLGVSMEQVQAAARTAGTSFEQNDITDQVKALIDQNALAALGNNAQTAATGLDAFIASLQRNTPAAGGATTINNNVSSRGGDTIIQRSDITAAAMLDGQRRGSRARLAEAF